MRKEYPVKRFFDGFYVGATLDIHADVKVTQPEQDITEYELTLLWDPDMAGKTDAYAAAVFEFPGTDLQYMWYPDARARRVLDADWRLNIHSMLTCSAPVATVFNGNGVNSCTMALDETRKVAGVELGVRDEGGSSSITAKAEIGLKQFETRNRLTLRIRMDRRKLPVHETVAGVSRWWEDRLGITPMPVPDPARNPVYSTWYNFHKDIDARSIISECRLAHPMGMDTVIVDDGWHTSNGSTGYGYTGDWEPCPEKFPDMKAFTDAIHAIGMKVMLWYSVPFVGYHSRNWEAYRGMLLKQEDRNSVGILDPRYPEVRKFVRETYVNAITRFGLDGLKLDFIDRIQQPSDGDMRPGMDFECVQEATDTMMRDVVSALRQIKPDIMIEFRQRYIGPCMRQYGNMFRVSDCPADITTNRVGIADLRMMSGNTAVHSDMLTWHDNDKAEDAALQILNTIFGVTQVSKKLAEMRPEHRAMLRFWLGFERENRHTLLESEFIPREPQNLYPVLTARDAEEEITAVYANDKIAELNGEMHTIKLINATWQPFLTLRSECERHGRVTVYNCMGDIVSAGELCITKGLSELPVPRSGLAVLKLLN